MIAEFLLRNVRVKCDDLIKAIASCDVDGDGYLSLGELIKVVKK